MKIFIRRNLIVKKNLLLSALVIGTLAIAPAAFAGHAGQSDQSGQCGQSDQSGQNDQSGQVGQSDQSGQSGQSGQCDQGNGGCHKKNGFFKKIGKAVAKGFDAVQNKVMDAGVSVKKAVTGKKCKTFVKGHYNSDGSHTKGHFRKTCKGSSKK